MPFMYDAGRNAFARGEISWKATGGSAIKAIAVTVDTGVYTASQATHDNLSDIVAGARVGTPVALTLLDPVAGVCDAADVSFTGLVAAPTIEAVVIYKDTGDEATSTLIAYIDNVNQTPAGINGVDVTWDNGLNKVFKL